jgi:outer membrane protein TolC
VFKASYENAMDNYLDIKSKYEQGVVAEYDLIRANVLVNNIEPNLIEAENSVKLAKWRLKALMGMDLDENIDCRGSLADYRSQLYGDYLSTDTSLAENSDLAQLELQTKLLSETIKLRKLDYVPTLTAAFLYQWNAMDNTFKFSQYRWNPYSMVGVTLTVPIFSGGSRYYKVKESNVSLEQLKLQREDVERSLNLVVRQSMDQMSTCIKKFAAAQRSVEQAEKGYLISQKRYDTGAGTLLELNDSELALTQSRLNYNQAIYEYVVAKSNLDKIAGRQN